MSVSKSKCCYKVGGLEITHLFFTLLFIGKVWTYSEVRSSAQQSTGACPQFYQLLQASQAILRLGPISATSPEVIHHKKKSSWNAHSMCRRHVGRQKPTQRNVHRNKGLCKARTSTCPSVTTSLRSLFTRNKHLELSSFRLAPLP